MKKIVVSVVCLVLAALATSANAASYTYSSVSTSVSGGSSASAVVNTIIGGSNSHSEVWINGKLVEQKDTPSVSRDTNRGIIEGIRTQDGPTSPSTNVSNEVRVQQNVQTINGSTTGQVHVFRKENGKVVEDRAVPLSQSDVGKPYLYRSAIHNGDSSASVEIHSMLASSSRAVVIRDLANASGLPWLLHVPFFSSRGLGVASSTTPEDRLLLSYDARRIPFDKLLDRILSMFR